jgi:hypothetical protein
MFEASLLESSGKLSGGNPWTTAASFAAQVLLSGTVILLSMIYTETLPQRQLISMLDAPASPPVTAAPHAAVSSGQATSEFDHNVVQLPREIPKSIAMVRDEAPPPGNAFGIDGDVPGGIPVGATGGVAEILSSATASLV